MTNDLGPHSRSPSTRQRALRRIVGALTLLLGCASTQLETGKNHPANPAAPTTQQSVGGALDADFDPQAVASAAAPLAQSGEKPQHAPQQWTCPMHPEIVRSEPGNCPICGMKLKPKAPQGGAGGPP